MQLVGCSDGWQAIALLGARVFWVVTRWLLTGSSQKGPTPSLYDILVSRYGLCLLMHVNLNNFHVFYLSGKNCLPDYLSRGSRGLMVRESDS